MPERIKFLDAVKVLQINGSDLPKTIAEFEQEIYELLKIPTIPTLVYQRGHSAFGFDVLRVLSMVDKIKQQLINESNTNDF